MIPKYVYNYQCHKDKKDIRDLKFKTYNKFKELPIKFNLKDTGCLPDSLNQLTLGSCTANSASNALRFCLRKHKKPDFQPSRLYIYYFSRFLENTVNEDSGVSIKTTMKAIHLYGVCSSKELPYDIANFKKKPKQILITKGKSYIETFTYLNLNQNELELKNALYQGYPIICGILVYETFESEETLKTGIVNLPKDNEMLYGGHCILLIGYDDEKQLFIFQNSWGDEVGIDGCFTIPYKYILDENLASDFWTITFF